MTSDTSSSGTAGSAVPEERPGPIDAVPVRHPWRWVAIAVIAVLAAMFVNMLLTNPAFDWGFIFEAMIQTPVIRGMLLGTLLTTVLAMVLGITLGASQGDVAVMLYTFADSALRPGKYPVASSLPEDRAAGRWFHPCVIAGTVERPVGFFHGESGWVSITAVEVGKISGEYEIRARDWDAPGNIKDYLTRLNAIRRENRALQSMSGLRFHSSSSPHVIFYAKATPARDNVILAAVNLDPFAAHESTLEIPLGDIGIAPDETYELHELLGGERRLMRGALHTVLLDPGTAPAHVYRVGRWRRRERDFDYYA